MAGRPHRGLTSRRPPPSARSEIRPARPGPDLGIG
jgi:hypothetical protein